MAPSLTHTPASSTPKANNSPVFPSALSFLLQCMTEDLQACTYVVDENFRVCFISEAMHSLFPQLTIGSLCYEALRGCAAPCEGCQMDAARRAPNGRVEAAPIPHIMGAAAKQHISYLAHAGKEYYLFNCTGVTRSKGEWADVDAFTRDSTLYHALCKSTDDFIYMCDMKTNMFYFPQNMVDEFGLPGQVVPDAISLWGDLIHPNERDAFFKDMEEMVSGVRPTHQQEYRVRNRKGKWIWFRCRGYLERDTEGVPTIFAGVLTNLGRRSKIDHLSGLLNKYEFEKHVDQYLGAASSNVGFLLLGLDNFKHINNLYGGDYGDEVLRISAQKIQHLLPPHFSLYRLDGDTFGVLFPKTHEAEIRSIYERIHTVFSQQQDFGPHRYYCTISGGYSMSYEQPVSFYTFFKRAEYALELSKKNGKSRLSDYSDDDVRDKDRSLLLIDLLRESIDNQFSNFSLHYQPQVQAESKKMQGAEALLRWHCDEFGSISPAEFIPLLEQTGFINAVGRFVLKEAVRTCLEWRNYHPQFVLSINISYLQLLDESFIPFVQDLLASVGLPPSALHMEITESCIASGSRSLTEAFRQIRSLGIHIEMDDFGTGYSSLEILKNEPADVVKIDRAFVKDITSSTFDATFIRFVVALCHSVNIKVCLEGVERWEEYELVKPMHVDIIQGYLFGKPQPKDEFEQNYFLK